VERRNYTSNRKKVDIKIYDYRPITPLSIAHKIFAILLNKRFSVIVKKKKRIGSVKRDFAQIN
jgi:hypothetical protein